MWKNTLALSAFVLSIGISFRLIAPAEARIGPSVSMGANPIASFGGRTTSSNHVVTNVPTDQDLIIRTVMTQSDCDLEVDGQRIIDSDGYFRPTYSYNRSANDFVTTAFLSGNARLRVPAGSELKISGCSNHSFYIDGYYTQP